MKTFDEMNTRERILDCVRYPIGYVRTATRIANYCEAPLANVSSLLTKMCKQGLLLRTKGYGPRGGYGYLMNPNRKAEVERILLITSVLPLPPSNPAGQLYMDHAGVRFEEEK